MEFLKNLLTKEQAYEQKDGTQFVELNKYKIDNSITAVTTIIDSFKEKDGTKKKIMYGCWCNWNTDDYECLGYKIDNREEITLEIDKNTIKGYDTLNTITARELKAKFGEENISYEMDHFFKDTYKIYKNLKYQIADESNFKKIILKRI